MPDAPSTHLRLSWDDVLAVHYQTGNYTSLGIWAQDNVPKLIEQYETLLDLLRVSVGFWVATPQEFIEAQHPVPNRDKVKQIAALLSNPATGYRDEDSGVWIDKPGPHARRPSNPAKSLCDMTHPGEPCPAKRDS